jgi:non-ribosomal peptide synthetase component F
MSKDILLQRYWLQKMHGAIPSLDLPTRCNVPGERNGTRNRFDIVIPDDIQAGIMRLVNGAVTGRYCCYATAFAILLSRYAGEEDIVITTPELKGNEDYNTGNVTFLRTPVDCNEPISKLLMSCKAAIGELYACQSYKYEDLLHSLEYSLQSQVNSLFQVGLIDGALQNTNALIRNCNLIFILSHGDGNSKLIIDFDIKYSELFIEQLADHYIDIMRYMISDVNRLVKETVLPDEIMKEQLLIAYNDTRQDVPLSTLPQLFKKTAKAIPDAPAIKWDQKTISYGELDELSDRFCNILISEKKILKGDIVAVCLESSFGLVISMLAIMKAGAVVLPLVPADPAVRLSFILSDSCAKLLITDDSFIQFLPVTADRLFFAEIYSRLQYGSVSSAQLPVFGCSDAYIIYTSGSTGRSKGTRLTHDNIINMLTWFKAYFDFKPADVLPQKTTIAFVDSIVEIFLPLTIAHSCVFLRPYDEINRDMVQLADWLKAIGTTIMQFVPSVFDSFYNVTGASGLPALRSLILSGEPLKNITPCHLMCTTCTDVPNALLLLQFINSEQMKMM